MYDREDVELALLALEEGMSTGEAAELVGCGETTVRDWTAGRPLHFYAGAWRRRATTGGDPGRVEAAMTESMPLGGVRRPIIGRLAPGFDLEREKMRGRREIARDDRPAPLRDRPSPGNLQELL